MCCSLQTLPGHVVSVQIWSAKQNAKYLRIELPLIHKQQITPTVLKLCFFPRFSLNPTPASRVALKRPPLYLSHLRPRTSGVWLKETENRRPSIWGCCPLGSELKKMEGFLSVFQRDLSLQNLFKLSGLSTWYYQSCYLLLGCGSTHVDLTKNMCFGSNELLFLI